MGVHALRERIRERIDRGQESRLALMFESFGYRHGIPVTPISSSMCGPCRIRIGSALRQLTGRDGPVIDYLAAEPSVHTMIAAIAQFLDARIAEFERADRSYLTIAIGCTGGQHRSVYIVDRLAEHFRPQIPAVLTRHDSLQKA